MLANTTSTVARKLVFCSTISEQSGEDPAGSAWATRRIIMAELPLPWPEDVLNSPHTPAGLRDIVYDMYERLEEPWGLIGIAPDPDYSIPGMTRIFDLRQPNPGFQTYQRTGYLVPSDRLATFIQMLGFDEENPELAAHREPDDQTTRDMLICTQGTIDACCATFGFPVYKLLKAMAGGAATPTRVWRCTHFGGHRFAATALDLPEGRYWAHLKADMLSKFIHRRIPFQELRRHYRGWAALGEPHWQLTEAELFAAAGWAWTNATITAIDGQTDPETGGTLTISFTHPVTGDGAAEVTIKPAGSVLTMESSKTAEYHNAPQFRASITNQQPAGVLNQIASIAPAVSSNALRAERRGDAPD